MATVGLGMRQTRQWKKRRKESVKVKISADVHFTGAIRQRVDSGECQIFSWYKASRTYFVTNRIYQNHCFPDHAATADKQRRCLHK
jgi:hypothetical protein